MSKDSSKPETANKAAPAAAKFGPVSALLVTLAAFFGSQILVGILVGAAITLSGKDTEQVTRLLTESTIGQFIFILLVELFALSVLYWFIRTRKISLAEIGMGRQPRVGDIGYALISFTIYFVLLLIILGIVGQLVPGINLEQEQQIGFKNVADNGSLALVFISLVILAPIAEEIMIRGFLYSGLRRKFTRIIAALIASIVFAVAHLQLGEDAPPLYVAAIDTFVLSMVLIGLRERTGSIWSGMLVHALKNGLAFTALFVLNLA